LTGVLEQIVDFRFQQIVENLPPTAQEAIHRIGGVCLAGVVLAADQREIGQL